MEEEDEEAGGTHTVVVKIGSFHVMAGCVTRFEGSDPDEFAWIPRVVDRAVVGRANSGDKAGDARVGRDAMGAPAHLVGLKTAGASPFSGCDDQWSDLELVYRRAIRDASSLVRLDPDDPSSPFRLFVCTPAVYSDEAAGGKDQDKSKSKERECLARKILDSFAAVSHVYISDPATSALGLILSEDRAEAHAHQCTPPDPNFGEMCWSWSGSETGVVVDVGHTNTTLTAFLDGEQCAHRILGGALCGKRVESEIRRMLPGQISLQGRRWGESVSREIKETVCYVATDFTKELQVAESNPYDVNARWNRVLTLGGRVGQVAFKSTECFFDGRSAERGLHWQVHDVVSRCDRYVQKDLLHNIILVGGTCALPGFKQRLEKELHSIGVPKVRSRQRAQVAHAILMCFRIADLRQQSNDAALEEKSAVSALRHLMSRVCNLRHVFFGLVLDFAVDDNLTVNVGSVLQAQYRSFAGSLAHARGLSMDKWIDRLNLDLQEYTNGNGTGGESKSSEMAPEVCGGRVLQGAALYDLERARALQKLPVDASPEHVLKLIAFDFDKTLASVHLYQALQERSACRTDDDFVTAYESMFSPDQQCNIFGGAPRLLMLQKQLKRLSSTTKLFVVTMGNCGIVRRALQDCELLRYIHGITDDNPKQQTVKVLMNSQFERRLRWDQAVLIDDSEKNFADASTPSALVEMGMSSEAVDLFFGDNDENGQSAVYRPRMKSCEPYSATSLVRSRQSYCMCLLVTSGSGVTEAQLDML